MNKDIPPYILRQRRIRAELEANAKAYRERYNSKCEAFLAALIALCQEHRVILDGTENGYLEVYLLSDEASKVVIVNHPDDPDVFWMEGELKS